MKNPLLCQRPERASLISTGTGLSSIRVDGGGVNALNGLL